MIRTAEKDWTAISQKLGDAIKKFVFVNGQLNLGDQNRASLFGQCLFEGEWKPAGTKEIIQCAETNNTSGFDNYIMANDSSSTHKAYDPEDKVLDGLVSFVGDGLTRADLKQMTFLGSLKTNPNTTVSDVDASRGKWCGMPAPARHRDSVTPAVDYWNACVKQNAGYFKCGLLDRKECPALALVRSTH